jgi:plastocyanin
VKRIFVGLTLAVLTGCAADQAPGTEVPQAAGGPYVVTAIDYHFHDAHPSLPISVERAIQFSNQGRNRHNVSIEGTSFDEMIRPGKRLSIDPIGSLLSEPGRYPFVCKIHADRGMSGVLVVVE